MEPDDRDPHAEGYDAALAGWSEDQNPYDALDDGDDFDAYTKWNDGWNAARDDMGEDDDG